MRVHLAMLLAMTALLAWQRHLSVFRPFEVGGVEEDIFIKGYFETGASLLPWLAVLAVCGAIARLALRGPLGRAQAAAGRNRLAVWGVMTLCLFTLVPGRPPGFMNMIALAVTTPWALLWLGTLLRSGAGGACEWAGDAAERLRQMPRALFLTLACGLGFALTLAAGTILFHGLPHTQDGYCYYLFGKLIAAGRLAWDLPAELEPFLFHSEFIVESGGRFTPIHPAGWPILLSLGHLAGAPWLAGPAITALFLLFLYLFVRRVASETTARTAVGLGLLSPFLILENAEYMSHPATLLCFQIFLWAFAVSLAGPGRLGWALLSGLALGASACCRPFTALALAFPIIVECAVKLVMRFRESFAPIFAVAIGGVLGLVPLLAINARLTGSPFQFVLLQEYFHGTFELGFGGAPLGTPHLPERALAQALANLNALNKYLFEWPLPSLCLVYLLLVFPRKLSAWELRAAACAISLKAFYLLEFSQDLLTGPRYDFEMLGLLFFLSAAGLGRAHAWLQSRGLSRLRARGALLLAIAGFAVAGNLYFTPGVTGFFGGEYLHEAPAFYAALEREKPGPDAVVVVEGSNTLWWSALPLEPVDFSSGTVYVRPGGSLEALRAAFPGRPVWRASMRPDGVCELVPIPGAAGPDASGYRSR